MKCKEGKEVEQLGVLSAEQYSKYLFTRNMLAVSNQAMNSDIVSCITDSKDLFNYYDSVFTQQARAITEELLLKRELASQYNVDVKCICIHDTLVLKCNRE